MADLPNNASQKNSLENDVEGSAGGVNVSAWISKNLLRGDILLALSVITLLVVLVLPMPTWALDAALAISITFSVLILITALFI
ncbi:MAG: EscV/YscV/HrcV family type III secretion system export apparatus protein, partial [Rhodospirillales bacterium]